jgi:NADH dehydrogenase
MSTAPRWDMRSARHRVVIAGGGAGGLQLATRLGDRLGRRIDVTLIDRERVHVWKPKLHEIAAGSMDMAAHEVDYLAQAHWHRFRCRIGAMIGLDRERREVHVAASHDDAGREVTPQRAFGFGRPHGTHREDAPARRLGSETCRRRSRDRAQRIDRGFVGLGVRCQRRESSSCECEGECKSASDHACLRWEVDE